MIYIVILLLGGTVEARLRGYRGGEGLIQIVQKKGQKALAYIVVDGMKQNAVSSEIYDLSLN